MQIQYSLEECYNLMSIKYPHAPSIYMAATKTWFYYPMFMRILWRNFLVVLLLRRVDILLNNLFFFFVLHVTEIEFYTKLPFEDDC